MKPVTLKEIADQLNISVTTVSKALKDYPDISKKTKALVKDLAQFVCRKLKDPGIQDHWPHNSGNCTPFFFQCY